MARSRDRVPKDIQHKVRENLQGILVGKSKEQLRKTYSPLLLLISALKSKEFDYQQLITELQNMLKDLKDSELDRVLGAINILAKSRDQNEMQNQPKTDNNNAKPFTDVNFKPDGINLHGVVMAPARQPPQEARPPSPAKNEPVQAQNTTYKPDGVDLHGVMNVKHRQRPQEARPPSPAKNEPVQAQNTTYKPDGVDLHGQAMRIPNPNNNNVQPQDFTQTTKSPEQNFTQTTGSPRQDFTQTTRNPVQDFTQTTRSGQPTVSEMLETTNVQSQDGTETVRLERRQPQQPQTNDRFFTNKGSYQDNRKDNFEGPKNTGPKKS